jgi:hypothetical protein
MKRHEVIGKKATLLAVHESNRCRAGSRYAAAALVRAMPEKRIKQQKQTLTLQCIDELAESSSVRRTLVVVKRKFPVNEPSCLDRGSAATRTVVRSISQVFGPDELTHISRINRR